MSVHYSVIISAKFPKKCQPLRSNAKCFGSFGVSKMPPSSKHCDRPYSFTHTFDTIQINANRQTPRGVVHTNAKRGDYSDFLKGVDPENTEIVSRVLEKGLRAVDRWDVAVTDFLTPPEAQDAELACTRVGDLTVVTWGGYPQAETQRLAVGRTEQVTASGGGTPEEILALVSVEGNFMFDPATHRDFLGAILNTGIQRSKVGDIVLQGEKGAQILLVPELVDFMETALTSVRSVPVSVSRVGLDSLNVRPPKVDTLRTVEASLRLDAVASAGFRMPRSKCADLISNGDVRVNWKGPLKPSRSITSGDVVSIRGKGRLEIGEISETKKGRYAIEITRYL